MVQQKNWIPEAMSNASGMEMEKLSLLGPFLGLSVFAEDNVRDDGNFVPLCRSWYIYMGI